MAIPSIREKSAQVLLAGIRRYNDRKYNTGLHLLNALAGYFCERMNFNRINETDLRFFRSLLGEAFVVTGTEMLKAYGKDETEDLQFTPDLVLKPGTAPEVASVLKYCGERKIAVTPRGAGTGLSGGALPVYGGIVLSTERLNRILRIDERNHQVITEPGVITQVLQDAVKEKGLFYPPDPASRGSCFIGGNIAENSGGPRAVKYGVVKDYVLNLEVALPNGHVIWTGANTLKNATGYNLTQLMVGSEGTLGIVTKIVLRLIPHPKHDLLILVPFRSDRQACEAVNAVFMAGILPSAMEFMERDAIVLASRFVEAKNIPLKEDIQAHLLIEVDGNEMDGLQKDMEKVMEVLQSFDTGEILFADQESQKQELWKLRRNVAEAVKRVSIYKEEDTVVPRAELPKLLMAVKAIGKKYGFDSVCYGHAGDGNLHVNILKGNMSDDDWHSKLPQGIREIFQVCLKLGGTLSGEHGIGWVQKEYMKMAFSEPHLQLMKQVKHVFDPKGVLNPGKMFE